MKLIFATAVALSCVFATGSAWAAPDSKQVATQILKDAAVGPYGVRVRTTADGVVHLTGSVISIRDWKTAESTARDVSGVTGVQNDLSVLVR